MTAKELYQAGKLNEAVQALVADLRNNPTDRQRRTFLFELLCFAGEFDRAEKHLGVIADWGNDAQMGALLYRAALHAERTRRDLFQKKEYPAGGPALHTLPGTINGKKFETLVDADPRIGPRLEVFAAGQYTWLPFEHIASVEMQAPKRLRDLLWAPAIVRMGPSFKDTDLGEVLLPVLTPLAYLSADEQVRLGRKTEWEEQEDGAAVPVGQKMLLVDGEEFPFLELRRLEFMAAKAPEHHASA